MSKATDSEQEQERPITTVQVIVVVPTIDGIDDINLWKRGEEILPGAHLAATETGNSVISGYQLEVIPVRVPQCDLNEGIVPLVKELTSDDNNIIGIVGYFCHNIARHFSQLIQHNKIGAVQISATSLDRDSVPYLRHSILPLSEILARSTVQLILRLEWSKVAVLSNQNLNFLDAKHAFLKIAKQQGIKVVSKLETNHNYLDTSPEEYLAEIQNVGAKIIIAFLPLSEAVDVLCTTYLHGFSWPHYAWIFTEFSTIEKVPNNSKFCSKNTTADALNGAIFLHPHLRNFHTRFNNSVYFNPSLKFNESFDMLVNASLLGNPYANVIYDSVWAIALSLKGSLSILNERNLSLNTYSNNIRANNARSEIIGVLEEQLSGLSFQGATGCLNFSHHAAAMQTSAKLLQFQNGQPVHIGSYINLSFNQLFLNEEALLRDIPSDTLNRIYVLYPTYVTVILLIMIMMCFALTSISMCLYFHYRKHPSIKATSSTLSFCLFIGCYFLLISSLFYTINSGIIQQKMGKSYRAFICMFDIYLINIGIDMVLATLIAKTLRIYHIFKKFGKVNQICSDQCLFILILTIVSIKIIFLILWTCLDISHLVDKEEYIKQSVPPHFLVRQGCQNKHLVIWITLQYTYSTALAFIMVLLAILTRKIKRGDFKDTKKINILVGALVSDMCICLTLWAVLRLVDSTTLSRVAYSVGITLAAFLCQVFLILPKTVPLVLRKCRCLNTWKGCVSTSYYAYFALKKTSGSEIASSL